MAPARLHRYSIVGENNPYWTIAEPLLLQIWADAIIKTRSINLHLVNLGAFMISILWWAGGAALRSAMIIGFLGIGFALFPGPLYASLHSVLWPSLMDGADIWIYRLVGYIIIIEGTVIVFASFPEFVLDCVLYVGFAATNMILLRLVAKHLQRGATMAQAIAKTSFMGVYIVQTIRATSGEDQRKWDTVMNLYLNSNQLSAREKLESLASEPV
jgi:hypothetical protein